MDYHDLVHRVFKLDFDNKELTGKNRRGRRQRVRPQVPVYKLCIGDVFSYRLDPIQEDYFRLYIYLGKNPIMPKSRCCVYRVHYDELDPKVLTAEIGSVWVWGNIPMDDLLQYRMIGDFFHTDEMLRSKQEEMHEESD